MWRKPIHTENFILKIGRECGLTPTEIKNQVNNFYGDNMQYYQVINFLRCLTADDMRFIFRHIILYHILIDIKKGENK